MTEAEAHAEAIKVLGSRAMTCQSRTRIGTDDGAMIIYIYEVGVAGDNWSWTVLGRGNSWHEALEQAKHPGARTRPAFNGPSKGGLDI